MIDQNFQMESEFEIEQFAERAYNKLDNSYMNGDICTYTYADEHQQIYDYCEEQYKNLKVRNL